MEPIIENTSGITKGIILETFRRAMRKKLYIFDGVGMLLIIFSLVMLFDRRVATDVDLSMVGICSGILFIVYMNTLCLPISAKRTYKRMQVLANEKTVNLTTRFYQERLELNYNNGDKRFIQYNDLRNYYITKNLYILAARENLVTMMKKDSFTKGTMEDAHKLIWGNK